MSRERREWARRRQTAAGLLTAALLLLGGGEAPAGALEPPAPPLFAWPYGTVQAEGGNIDPAVQPIIALVNGRACGEAMTQVAVAGPGTPASDVGKTVYVVDVLADGARPGERPGCGAPGLAIRFWFPVAGRFAQQEAVYAPGGQRVDLELGPVLPFRMAAPLVAADGVN